MSIEVMSFSPKPAPPFSELSSAQGMASPFPQLLRLETGVSFWISPTFQLSQ